MALEIDYGNRIRDAVLKGLASCVTVMGDNHYHTTGASPSLLAGHAFLDKDPDSGHPLRWYLTS